MTDDRFRLVGVRPQSPAAPVRRAPWYRGKPIFSAAVLTLIVLGCLFCEVLLTHDPTYLDLAHCNEAPSREFLFGTDPMGRDIFSMIWYGGRISLTIGVLSTLLSTAIAILFGTVSGCAPDWLDRLLMRLTEILLSVSNLLLVVLLTLLRANTVGVAIRFAGAPVWMLGYIFLSGAVAITAMVLPGISGSTILLIAGVYLPAIQAIRAFLGFDFSVFPGLCALGLGGDRRRWAFHSRDSRRAPQISQPDGLADSRSDGRFALCDCHGSRRAGRAAPNAPSQQSRR